MLEPIAEAERLRPLAVGRAEVADEARDDVVESDVVRARCRNGRGSRFPKKLPVCVIRKRVAAVVLEPGEVVEVAAVRDRA